MLGARFVHAFVRAVPMQFLLAGIKRRCSAWMILIVRRVLLRIKPFLKVLGALCVGSDRCEGSGWLTRRLEGKPAAPSRLRVMRRTRALLRPGVERSEARTHPQTATPPRRWSTSGLPGAAPCQGAAGARGRKRMRRASRLPRRAVCAVAFLVDLVDLDKVSLKVERVP